MIDPTTLAKAEAVLGACRTRGLKVATAESCTGGLVAAALTAIAGSSDVVERGFVTYSNKAKIDLLGVQGVEIATVGAVSEDVARAMAQGALVRSPADLAVSITGVAGPGGGSADKPVGLVWFGCARRGGTVRTLRRVFPGDRAAVRAAATEQALDLLLEAALAPP
jgi:nicotinamide-nucleotide amidase